MNVSSFVFLLGLLLISLYITWALFNYISALFAKYKLKWPFTGITLFNSTLAISILGLLLARLWWLVTNINYVKSIGFWFLPYVREGMHIQWLQYYPWRFLNFYEGINILTFKISLAVLFLLIFVLKFFKLLFRIKGAGLYFYLKNILIVTIWYLLINTLIWFMIK